MPTASEVLAHLAAAGVTLTVDGDRLIASSPAALTDHHRDLIRRHKRELLDALTSPRRLWDIVEPSGACWRSCVAPPQTLAQILAAYGPGTVAVPVEDPDKGQPLPPDIEAAVLAWLNQIGEHCPDIRAQILDRARDVPEARADYLSKARPGTPQRPNHEGTHPTGTDPQENRA